MNTEVIAMREGVPTPEICKKIDWQGETRNFWAKFEGKESYNLCFHLNHSTYYYYDDNGNIQELGRKSIIEEIKAPLMHEIFPQQCTLLFSYLPALKANKKDE